MSDYHVYPSPITDPDIDVVVSPGGIIHVLGYTPTEGEPGAPISARIHFRPDFSDAIYVRLVLDDKPVPTAVREIYDTPYGRWQLDAVAPPFDKSAFMSPKVLISVQALNKDNKILDAATFGEFLYWTPGLSLTFLLFFIVQFCPRFIPSCSPFTNTRTEKAKTTYQH